MLSRMFCILLFALFQWIGHLGQHWIKMAVVKIFFLFLILKSISVFFAIKHCNWDCKNSTLTLQSLQLWSIRIPTSNIYIMNGERLFPWKLPSPTIWQAWKCQETNTSRKQPLTTHWITVVCKYSFPLRHVFWSTSQSFPIEVSFNYLPW